MEQYKYRLTSCSGFFDKQDNDYKKLIKEASNYIGLFILWQWNEDKKQWIKFETFLFNHYNPIILL